MRRGDNTAQNTAKSGIANTELDIRGEVVDTPARPRSFGFAHLWPIAALCLFVASLSVATSQLKEYAFPAFTDAQGIALVFFLLAVQPRIASAIMSLWAFWYLLKAEIILTLVAPVGFLALMGMGSVFWSRVATSRVFPGERVSIPLAVLLFLSTTALMSFSLLAVHRLYPSTLLVLSLGFALTGLCASARAPQPPVARRSETVSSPLEGFLNATLLLMSLLAALYYLHPMPLAGDSNKAYLAWPWYYAVENTLFLREEAWERNVMGAYHHTQELLLAAGYALGEKLGMKVFALALVLLKFQAIYVFSRSILKLSSSAAKMALVCFTLLPIVVELNGIVRPENALTILGLYFLYFMERARGMRVSTETERPTWLSAFLLANACICLAVSVKLTGMYFGAAALVVYWREYFAFLGQLRRLRVSHWLLISSSLAALCLWFARNFYQFGKWGNMSPYGRYHLTVWFPPIRSFESAWDFLRSGLIATGRFTEFPDFGYGLWGLVLLPILFFWLSNSGSYRRMALVSGVFFIALLSSTTQIRYIAPIVPVLIALGCAILLPLSQRLSAQAGYAIGVSVVLVQALSAYSVNTRTGFVRTLYERLPLPVSAEDFREFSDPFATLNEVIRYPQKVLCTYLDQNFTLNGILFRGDPINNLADLRALQERQRFPYWLYFSYDASRTYNRFFNDEGFIESVAEPLRKAPFPLDPSRYLTLFRVNNELWQQLLRYVEEQGWDLRQTILVSERYKRSNPFEVRLGERIMIAGLKEPLYRLSAYFPHNQLRFINVESVKDPIEGQPRAVFLEDKPEGASMPRLQVSTRMIGLDSGSAGFKPAEIGVPAQRVYEIEIPQLEQGRQYQLEVYVRGARAAGAPLIGYSIRQAEQEVVRGKIDALRQDAFELVDTAPIEAGKAELSFSLRTDHPAQLVSLRDVRLVLAERSAVENRAPIAEVREVRAYPHLFELGTPLRTDVAPLWFYERFTDGIAMRARGMRLHRRNENIEVREIPEFGKVLTLEEGRVRGRTVYTLPLPTSLYNDVFIKLYLGRHVIAEGDAIRLQVRDPHANSQTSAAAPHKGVYYSGVFRDGQVGSLTPVAELRIPFVASPVGASATTENRAGLKRLEIEIEFISVSGKPIALEEVLAIVGKG